METVTIPQADNAPEHLLNVREEALFDVLADMEDGLAFSPRLEGRLKRVQGQQSAWPGIHARLDDT